MILCNTEISQKHSRLLSDLVCRDVNISYHIYKRNIIQFTNQIIRIEV